MFTVGQKVWCAIYGAGVVTEIQHASEGAYSVEVTFNDDLIANYTRDGKIFVGGNITLFSYPVEIVKAITKPSIDWSHVSKYFKWLAMDADSKFHLYTDKPLQGERQWVTNLPCTPAIHFASFIPGTCDWKDSLVKRPE